MAKKHKKNIKQIQDALLSKAGFIKQSTEAPEIYNVEEESNENYSISPEILDKFEALAEYENVEYSVLIEKALNHYLKLKGLQLDEALKNRKK
jgi:hypothetical protein